MSQKTTIKFDISNKRLIAIIILLLLSCSASGPAVNIDDVRNRIQELKKKEKEYTSKMYPSGSKLMKMNRDQLDGALRDKATFQKLKMSDIIYIALSVL